MSIANIKRYAMRNIKLKPMAQQSKMQELIEVRFEGDSITTNLSGFGEVPKSHFSLPEEVIRVNAIFFKKPHHQQKEVLRLLIWWAIKHYFKILFK